MPRLRSAAPGPLKTRVVNPVDGASDWISSRSVIRFWYTVTFSDANWLPNVASKPASISVLRSGLMVRSPSCNAGNCPNWPPTTLVLSATSRYPNSGRLPVCPHARRSFNSSTPPMGWTSR